MSFVSGFVYCVANLTQLDIVYEVSSSMTQFTPPEIWKQHAMLLAFTAEVLIQIFRSVSLSIYGQCRGFEKSWMSPVVITKVRQLVSLVLIVLVGKKLQNLLETDIYPSKSIRSITRDMEVSEFHIRQVVHEDIRYFSYNLRKPIFITGCEFDRGITAAPL